MINVINVVRKDILQKIVVKIIVKSAVGFIFLKTNYAMVIIVELVMEQVKVIGVIIATEVA